jgi:hypothetical protein
MTVTAGGLCRGARLGWRHAARPSARWRSCTTGACRTLHQGVTAATPAAGSSWTSRLPPRRPALPGEPGARGRDAASLDRSRRGRAPGFAGKPQAVQASCGATPELTKGATDMRGIPGGCCTRTGKRRSSSRSALAVSPPSSPTTSRDWELAGESPRWPKLPPQRHVGAEPHTSKPHLVDEPAQQPRPRPRAASASVSASGGGWAGRSGP